jgi:predicted mannosyl-3-phosphoglycerate phosphatase (HAD superfamily)
MNKADDFRILAIAPTSRGVGFAVLEGKDSLVDWGVKTVQGEKNANSLTKVEELIAQYQPGVLVLQDTKDSRKSQRIKVLSREIVDLAETRNISVKLFSQEQEGRTYFTDGLGTKQEIAELIAQRFPDELGSRLPQKRKAWMSEQYQMGIYDAVALALILRLNTKKRREG